MGDQGTTASVSAYGDLLQMSQFLGAGSSGVFSTDHEYTAEPYLIDNRADDLNRLSLGNDDLSFGLYLPREFLPYQIPKMRWVNWRWPRYECKYHSKWTFPPSLRWKVMARIYHKHRCRTKSGWLRVFELGRGTLANVPR